MTPIRFQAVILRKQLDLPCYIIVKPDLLGAVTGAFDAEVSLNGSTPFPRRIHPWGKGSVRISSTRPKTNAARLVCRLATAATWTSRLFDSSHSVTCVHIAVKFARKLCVALFGSYLETIIQTDASSGRYRKGE